INNNYNNLLAKYSSSPFFFYQGTNKKRNHSNQRVKRPDYKVAYVQLAQQQTFQFPDIFPEKDKKHEEGSVEEMQETFMEDERQRQKSDPRRGGVTEWFGL
uniref:39S ribosomal protein L23, mitochondrial n=1 Tax=Sinocyclocheilus rhinocerous TaxID=307959 RepID=A0A673K6U4_9TELE